MKIAIVGPSHPYKGGIAQHTTRLAQHLSDTGNDVEIISWRVQYPFFYPGVQTVPDGKPEQPLFKTNRRVLSWKNPLGWIVWARYLRQFDKVIFVWWVPMIQGPVYSLMIKAMGKHHPKTILVCHNIVSHHSSPLDKYLTRSVFNAVDQLVVHTQTMGDQAQELTSKVILIAKMPAHLPGSPIVKSVVYELQYNLLFFGLVRHYKGVDILINALSKTKNINLVIAGEIWGKQEAILKELISMSDMIERVKLIPGYVASDKISELFASCDALVMPYRSGTASQNAEMAFAYGRPVIATNVGSMPNQINDGVDGLLCKPDDVESLAAAIEHFYKPGVAQKLSSGIKAIDLECDWPQYIMAITD